MITNTLLGSLRASWLTTLSLLLTFGLSCLTQSALAQTPAVIVEQDFAPGTPVNWHEYTTKLLWGTYTTPTSAFSIAPITDNRGITNNAITVTDSAMKYAAYQLPNGLRTSQVLDFDLGTLDRSRGDSITVELDLLWPILSSGGEKGRVVVALMHQNPDFANIPFGLVDSVGLLSPFGRPAYNWRVTNRLPLGQNQYAHLFYGGGKDREGEVEKFSNPTVGSWWLPGFISMPTGLTPGVRPLYPAGPGNSWGPYTIANANLWTRYKMVLSQEFCTVTYQPPNGGPVVVVNSIYIPKIDADTLVTIQKLNAYYGTSINKMPPLYQYWDIITGLRVFMNSGERAYVSNIKVTYSGTPVSAKGPIDTEKPSLKVWPNPASLMADHVMVNVKGIVPAQISLSDAMGRKVYSNTSPTSGDLTIPTKGLASGVYTIRCLGDNGQQLSQRISIQR